MNCEVSFGRCMKSGEWLLGKRHFTGVEQK